MQRTKNKQTVVIPYTGTDSKFSHPLGLHFKPNEIIIKSVSIVLDGVDSYDNNKIYTLKLNDAVIYHWCFKVFDDGSSTTSLHSDCDISHKFDFADLLSFEVSPIEEAKINIIITIEFLENNNINKKF
jgi:hypothetical protein